MLSFDTFATTESYKSLGKHCWKTCELQLGTFISFILKCLLLAAYLVLLEPNLFQGVQIQFIAPSLVRDSKLQKSPSIMAKRSQRRPLRHEKDQGGCISGFMSIFDFRHGRSTRKLLADRRRGSRQTNASTGVGSSSNGPTVTKSNDKFHNTKEAEKSETATPDAVKTSVKKLMEEEMIHEQVPEKQMNVSREGSEELNPEHVNRARKHRRRRSRTSKSVDMDIYDGDSLRHMELDNLYQHISEQKMLDNIDLEAILEELCQIRDRSTDSFKNDSNSDLDVQSDQAYAVAEEKLNAAIKVFMCQRLTNNTCSREDGSTNHSKEVMDALRTISSNKELFLKLLQDPNSLLVKHIKGFEGAPLTNDQKSNSLPGSNILEEAPTKSEPDEPITRKHRKFFQRRSKSQDSFPLEGDETCHSSSKIVILKPGPAGSGYPDNRDDTSTSLQSRFSFDNKVQGDKHASHFSFTEIKRRLKHAMGKERQITSSDEVLYRLSSERQNRGETEKGIGGENLGWSSPNRNHFYTERFAKPPNGFRRGDNIAQSKDVEAAITSESSGYPKQGVSNIYMEAKKHLSEMLNNGEADAELIRGQLPKSLGRILSLPEYEDSPRCSPENETEDSFITAKMRLSPRGTPHGINDSTLQHIQEKHDGYSSPSMQNIGDQIHKTGENYREKGQFPDAHCSATCQVISENSVEETTSSHRDVIQEIDKITKTTDQEEDEMLNVLEISISSSPTSKDDAAVCDEEKSSRYLELESFEEDQESSSPLASPSCSSVNTKVEDPEKVIDRTDRPSPISVLEPLFSEDDISPASTKDLQVELEIHPRKIHFEEQSPSVSDQGISAITCMEDGESPFEYVEAVLLGSGLNWDEFLLRWLSSDQILDPSLFDEVELFSSRHHDQKLLFDCTNEVLKEVCDRYFGCFIGISFVKQSIRPAPRGMNLIHEIWKGVEWHLLQHPSSNSLDQLVKKDMTKSEMWMNPHLDVEQIGIEMEEAIFEELVEDTVSSFVDDYPECLSTDFRPVSLEIEISIDSLVNLIQEVS